MVGDMGLVTNDWDTVKGRRGSRFGCILVELG